jgi:hypothetical protein
MKRIYAIAAAVLIAFGAAAEKGPDMPAYDILAEDGRAEIRLYAPQIVAEVTIKAGSLSEAASEGFRPLANYIFGANTPRQKIEMTSPVTVAPKGQKIAMTAPVTAAPADAGGDYVVHFLMPPEWTLDTLPAPSNPAIVLKEMPARTVAALRYNGPDTASRRQKVEADLREFGAQQGFRGAGAAEWAGYDSPMVPFFLRRYEIIIPLPTANKE